MKPDIDNPYVEIGAYVFDHGVKAATEYFEAQIARLTPRKVVAAVIRSAETGNYIIGKRTPEQWMPGKWCFVGGKVEPGEELKAAVIREVGEELGIEVQVGELIHQQLEKYDHGIFHLHYFECIMPVNQVPQLLACSDTASVSADRLPMYDLLPVDVDIAQRIAQSAMIKRLEEQLESQQRRQLVLMRFVVSYAHEMYDKWDTSTEDSRVGKMIKALWGHIPGYRPDTDSFHDELKKLVDRVRE